MAESVFFVASKNGSFEIAEAHDSGGEWRPTSVGEAVPYETMCAGGYVVAGILDEHGQQLCRGLSLLTGIVGEAGAGLEEIDKMMAIAVNFGK